MAIICRNAVKQPFTLFHSSEAVCPVLAFQSSLIRNARDTPTTVADTRTAATSSDTKWAVRRAVNQKSSLRQTTFDHLPRSEEAPSVVEFLKHCNQYRPYTNTSETWRVNGTNWLHYKRAEFQVDGRTRYELLALFSMAGN